MAACDDIDPEVASLFGDSGDEESFDGFGEGGGDDSNNSDIDLDGLEAEEEHAGPQVPEVPQPGNNTDNEEARWTLPPD